MKKAPALRSYTLFYLLFLYGPIILLPIFAFNDSRVVAFPLQGFTTGWFAEMWADANLRIAAKNSLIIALSVATLSTVLGIFAARASVRYRFPGKAPIMGLIMLAAGIGTTIRVDATGGEARAAVAALSALVQSGFGEED